MRRIVAQHLLLVAFAAWKMFLLPDDLRHLFRSQPVAFDQGGVMRGNRRELSRKEASTDAVIGKCRTASFAASMRIKLLAILDVIANFGSNGIITAVSRKFPMPLLCR